MGGSKKRRRREKPKQRSSPKRVERVLATGDPVAARGLPARLLGLLTNADRPFPGLGFGLLLFVTVAAIHALITWDNVDAFVLSIDHCKKLFCDLKNHYYPMGRQIFETGEAMWGYYYSPTFAVLLGVLARLPLDRAVDLWLWLQLAGAAVLVLVPGAVLFRRRPVFFYAYCVLSGLSLPLLHNFKWGQVNVWVFALVTGAMLARSRRRSVLAGVLLALGVAVQFYAGVFALYFVFKRDWRFCASFAVSCVVILLGVPAVTIGPGETVAFYQAVAGFIQRAAETAVPRDPNSQFLAHVVSRLAMRSQGAPLTAGALNTVRLVGFAVVLAHFALVWRLARREGERYLPLAFALLFTTLPLLIITSWTHYFVHLPFVATTGALLVTGLGRGWRPVIRAAIFAPLVVSAALFSAPVLGLFDQWRGYAEAGLVLFATLLLLPPLYAVTYAALRQSKVGGDSNAES